MSDGHEHERVPSRTGIIATLGPATDSPEVLERLVHAGVSIFRLNFSHGEPSEHEARIAAVRDLEARCGLPLAIMADLPGPKIRVVEVAGDGIDVQAGEDVVFERQVDGACQSPAAGEPLRLACTWSGLIDSVKAGQRVLINDGAIRLLATESSRDQLWCRVTSGGLISSHKGVNLPDTDLDIEVPTARDRQLVTWAMDHDVDIVAMSFVRSRAEVEALRAVMTDHLSGTTGRRPLPIVAKIEVPPAVDAAEEIIAAANAVMVARGDLGVEMDLARVPIIQKRLLALSRSLGRPCIVATQMLQSMIDSPVPTRAEASDVAGAIFDGADAVMLSGETAVGRYPVVAVETMRHIGDETEAWMDTEGILAEAECTVDCTTEWPDDSRALVSGIWSTARAVGAKCIVVFSEWGTWSRLLSRSTQPLPIVAYTPHQKVVRQMLLCRGVTPEVMEIIPDEAILTRDVEHRLSATGWLSPGDAVIVVLGRPLETTRNSTRITVHRVTAGKTLE
ncbi:MAG: pyruvate kinase [Phycisphaerales bacterium]|nr:pyruvate kinase [Phycisphaerales bacterium]